MNGLLECAEGPFVLDRMPVEHSPHLFGGAAAQEDDTLGPLDRSEQRAEIQLFVRPTGAGSKLRVIPYLSPYLLRGMSMSPTGSSTIPKAIFLVLSDRSSSRERQLLWELLCVAEDERQSCLDRRMVTIFDDLPDRLGLSFFLTLLETVLSGDTYLS